MQGLNLRSFYEYGGCVSGMYYKDRIRAKKAAFYLRGYDEESEIILGGEDATKIDVRYTFSVNISQDYWEINGVSSVSCGSYTKQTDGSFAARLSAASPYIRVPLGKRAHTLRAAGRSGQRDPRTAIE